MAKKFIIKTGKLILKDWMGLTMKNLNIVVH